MRLKKSRWGFSLRHCPVTSHIVFTCISLPRSLMLRQSSQPDLQNKVIMSFFFFGVILNSPHHNVEMAKYCFKCLI